MYNNKKKQVLDKYKGKDEGNRYIFFSFIALLTPVQKE